ncbi:MAG: peptidylprolyl isomerase [Bacteroidetes bacterium]|nr:peptidylprolyl isomerase [Bacteroidota bacterium]MDA1121692.1 peptidylprolyl isomerase [Bacteroidota bacterium]
MRLTKTIAIIILSVFCFASSAQVVDKIIAKVDNYILLKSDLEKAYLEIISGGQQPDQCRLIESLLISKMLAAKAEIDSVVVSQDEVDSNLDRRLQYFVNQVGSEEAIELYYGKTLEQFKIELEENIKEQLTSQKMEGEITDNISVSPAEVRKFFKDIPTDSLPYFSTEVKVGQIVKTPEVSKSQKDQTIQKLNGLRQQIIAGEDFNVLAKKFSMDPSVVQNGGELGFQRRGILAPEFEAMAFNLEQGDISPPFETDFGIHILQLIERRGNSFNSRHILMIPQPLESDIERAIGFLDSLRNLIILDSIGFAKAAKEHSDDQATSSNGGFYQDANGSSRVPVDQLDPVIFFTVDTMKLGSITKPLRYRMDDGSEAARIFFYEQKLAPHQANLKDDYQKIYGAALNQKKATVMEKWFLKARDDVYVEIDPEFDQCNIMNRIN